MSQDLVTTIPGIGPQIANRLQNIGIRTITDLLLHLPRDYENRTKRTKLAEVNEAPCVVQGVIIEVDEGSPRFRRGIQVHFEDGTGRGSMRLFRYSPQQRQQLVEGAWLYLYGKPAFARTFFHPQYRVHHQDPGEPVPEYRPVYPATAAISSARIHSWIKRSLHESAFFPKFTYDGATLAEAIREIHQPDASAFPASVEAARRRVMLDEMLAFLLLKQRHQQHLNRATIPLPSAGDRDQRLLARLGFQLTPAQRRTAQEVVDDLARPTAMRRLIQGDVGSGKTIIAALAAIRAAENETQTAIMAPTELLAEQHFQVFSEWFTPLGIDVALLTSRIPLRQRRSQQLAITNRTAQVVIGTHALLQEKTIFDRLSLAIIDEQHRFGVHQRMQLSGKGQNVHQLVLTATPIPRTLALTMFGDLAVSTIDELPPGRTPIKTTLHSGDKRDEVIDAIEQQLRNGQQIYWVCVAIDENEENNLTASTTTYEELKKRLVNIGVGHVNGRMKVDEKRDAMAAFRDGETRLLVATTVIEVGIDVTNASVMVIENAERLGLAQLHQLRGRVGRGSQQSYCLLLHETPLVGMAKNRLEAMKSSNDGFKLAEIDLNNRGMGQMFGKQQSGADPFRIASLEMFVKHFTELRTTANDLLRTNPTLADEIIATWSPAGQGYAAS